MNASQRSLTIYDGEVKVHALLTPDAAEKLDKSAHGIGVRKLLGRTLAPIRALLVPYLNRVPPSVTVVLQEVKVFADCVAQRPERDPEWAAATNQVTVALRARAAELYAKPPPTLPPIEAGEASDEEEMSLFLNDFKLDFPPQSIRLEAEPTPPEAPQSMQREPPRPRVSLRLAQLPSKVDDQAPNGSSSDVANPDAHLAERKGRLSVPGTPLESKRRAEYKRPDSAPQPRRPRTRSSFAHHGLNGEDCISTDSVSDTEHEKDLPKVTQALIDSGQTYPDEASDHEEPVTLHVSKPIDDAAAMESTAKVPNKLSASTKGPCANKTLSGPSDEEESKVEGMDIVSAEKEGGFPDDGVLEVVDLPMTQHGDESSQDSAYHSLPTQTGKLSDGRTSTRSIPENVCNINKQSQKKQPKDTGCNEADSGNTNSATVNEDAHHAVSHGATYNSRELSDNQQLNGIERVEGAIEESFSADGASKALEPSKQNLKVTPDVPISKRKVVALRKPMTRSEKKKLEESDGGLLLEDEELLKLVTSMDAELDVLKTLERRAKEDMYDISLMSGKSWDE